MIVAGFGFSTRATLASLRDALAQTGGTPEALATAHDKAAQLAPLADDLGLPLRRVSAEALTAQDTTTRSAASQTTRGTGSVAEAAALAAAGPGARLIAPRTFSSDRLATCALARSSAQGKTP
ncbi:cobalamin biosynthesis protein [Marinovum sp.]|uniref:cobalamin biosynthesis protein n=1 Tax=Marinovum sp. TaxID=2024839 RepID=UPI002B269CBF|nr:cobalamin biosynthesis protein [Marinovum sp.]